MRKAIKDQAVKLAAAIRETDKREIEYRIGSFGLELADGGRPPAHMLRRIQQLSIQSETVCQWAETSGARRDCKLVRSARDGAYYLGEYRWLDNNGLRYDVVYYQAPKRLEPQIRSLQKQAMAQELGVFSTASANGSDSGGGSCSPCAPAASFTEGRDAWRLSYLTSRRRGRTPVAIPAPAAFSRLLSPLPNHGAGALPQFRPSPSFPLFGGEIR